MEINTSAAESVNRYNPLENKLGYNVESIEAVPPTRNEPEDVETAAPVPMHDIWGGVNYYRAAKGRKMCSPSRIF